MRKIYSVLSVLLLTITMYTAKAQCPTAFGMTAVPVSLNGNCFINIQFAIPNSNVSIYNAGGFVAQGVANASGAVVISYPCSANQITSILSLTTSPSVQLCTQATITAIIPLPVKLSSFAGTLTAQKTVKLNWETEFEVDNDKFELEKSSDGIHYSIITTVNCSGTSFSKKSYDFEDATFSRGATAFYRLKQTDFDGKTAYSKVVYVDDKQSVTGEYGLFPNPLQEGNTVQLKGVAAADVTYKNIRVTDIMGRNVNYIISGANSIELDPTAPSGLYIVRVLETALKLMKN